MYGHTSGFIQNNQIRIFEQDRRLNLFPTQTIERTRNHFTRSNRRYSHLVALNEPVVRLFSATIYPHLTPAQHLVDFASRNAS